MATVVVSITSGTNSTGPYGTGTGNGYYDGLTNGGPASGSVTSSPNPPTLQGSVINALAESSGGATPGFTVCVAGTHPQNYFDSIAFNATNVLTSVGATFTQFTSNALPYTRWVWAGTTGVVPSSGSITFTLTYTPPATPPTLVQGTPTVVSATEVEVSWTPTVGTGADAGTFTGFQIYRGGVQIASVPSTALFYFDQTCQPSTTYTYQIQGTYSLGGFSPVISGNQNATTPDLTSEFNCDCTLASPYATLAALRTRMLIRLGYPNQASNPPPGMLLLIDEFLRGAQTSIYRQLQRASRRTERFFKWTMVPGQRYYGVAASEGGCGLQLDPEKITWVGFEDLNQAWYRLDDGIPPEFYTRANINFGWPTRYEIRSCIEVFPAPQAAYTLWIKGDIGLAPLVSPSDTCTIDDEAVFLLALGDAKTHYGQKDAGTVLKAANNYILGLVAGTHGTKRYVPRAEPGNPLTPPKFLPLGS